MRYVWFVITLVVFMVAPSMAQQPAPLSPQDQLDRARLELVYVEREHTMCKQSLADLWARVNGYEAQVRQLQDELKALKDKSDAPPKEK